MTPETESLIDRALTEDLSLGDPTTEVLISPESTGSGDLVAKEEGVLAGLDVGLAVFKRVDATLETAKALEDSFSAGGHLDGAHRDMPDNLAYEVALSDPHALHRNRLILG